MMFDPPDDINRLSYWFPRATSVLDAAFYPRTETVTLPMGTHITEINPYLREMSPQEIAELPAMLDWPYLFADRLAIAADQIGGFPVFFRSELMSGKHDRSTPCIVGQPTDFLDSMRAIAMQTEANTWTYQGCDRWSVRELFDVDTDISAFGGLPVGREIRYIVKAGVIEQYFLYWPKHAIAATAKNRDTGIRLTDLEIEEHIAWLSFDLEADNEFLAPMTLDVANAVGGEWSVDWMLTTTGWKMIDMAVAAESWTPEHGRKEQERIAAAESFDWSSMFVKKGGDDGGS